MGFVLLIIVFGAVWILQHKEPASNHTQQEPPTGTQLITSENMEYVGQDLSGEVIVLSPDEAPPPTPVKIEIPENDYFDGIQGDMMPPLQIDAVTVEENTIPPIMMYNGAMALFTNGSGWALRGGERI